jgi:hypothetical protein
VADEREAFSSRSGVVTYSMCTERPRPAMSSLFAVAYVQMFIRVAMETPDTNWLEFLEVLQSFVDTKSLSIAARSSTKYNL